MALTGLLLAVGIASASPVEVSFDDERWIISGSAHMQMQYQGRQALYLHNGAALLDGVMLKNGIVEFHVAFSGERGFVGPVWHVTDPANYEYFYIRPHQSGNPDANQYTPVFNGIPGWQLYHGPGYGTPVRYPYNEWIRVRVVFWEGQAQIFIEDMDDPVLEVPHLKLEAGSGGIGLRAQNAPAYVSGFSYRALDKAPFARIPLPELQSPEGRVMRWEVSSPFAASRLQAIDELDPSDFPDLDWQPLQSEPSGIVNLARLYGNADGRDTVIARAVIRTTRGGGRTLLFGYSDKVRVFVNGRAVYSGDNTFRSRDYRYLGTIGLFDAVHLPLESGDNEVWFAVTEAFGGWGIQACLCDSTDIDAATK